jgi:hypothetical protein
MKTPRLLCSTFATCAALLAMPAPAAEPGYSPYAERGFAERLLWGDTHLHTNVSADAAAFGNSKIGPEQAFRFARGETVTAHNSMPVRLSRPLDFLVVADHGEYLGVLPGVRARDPLLMQTETGRRWAGIIESGVDTTRILMEWGAALDANRDLIGSGAYRRSIWDQVTATADRFNEPGRFSAFAGYEWTSMPDGDNLHRVVMFADGAERTQQVLPFTALDSLDPEALWSYLDDYEKRTGGQALAIPHNSNVSGGLMFRPQDFSGAPFDKDYATRRARWEPLVEVTQIKGDSETHPLNSPTDEFAGYEIWDRSNLGMRHAQTPAMQPFQYARSALRIGLAEQARIGVNPFEFGMIGSTDAHTGLATAEENNFWGKATSGEPSHERAHMPFIRVADPTLMMKMSEMAASGYMAVWARANTREDIFAAMKRREVYATTGPRMQLRFFGGFNFEPGDASSADVAATGYGKGVPMGGELGKAPAGQAPRFLVSAMRDPIGANLDRVQVVKGWLGKDGETAERVYNVAWSDARRPGADGKLPPVGSTVDVASATWQNTIGAGELSTVWTDPDFDPAQSAFWYLRVIEIPTPRWTAFDARYFGDTPDAARPAVQQERAYSSPIWYRP